MADADDYIGREQSWVKHYILEHYLKRFARIIGSRWGTITYIDCFSGPWESKTSDLSDTSFAIALRELEDARQNGVPNSRLEHVRCMFLERKTSSYARLQSFSQAYILDHQRVSIETRNASLEDSVPDIVQFATAGGSNSFPFVFIDPTGWTGFDTDTIRPLLRLQPGEVLVNFMTEHIRRFLNHQDPDIRASFDRMFGSPAARQRLAAVVDPQDREDELVRLYADQIRQAGQFEYTCSAVVLSPSKERTHFHLVYATRSRRGVEVFKDVEKRAMDEMDQVRDEVHQRRQIERTGQPSLFAGVGDTPPSHRIVVLRTRYLAEAEQAVQNLLGSRRQIAYDELWDTAMRFPLVWESDLKEWISEWVTAGRIRILNLEPRKWVPRIERNHVIERLQ